MSLKPTFLLLLVISSTLFVVKPASSAKILAVEFFGSKSHVITYLALLEELARRGHDVTLLSPLPITKDLGGKENPIKQIFTFDMSKLMEGENNMFDKKENNVKGNPFVILTEFLPKECKKVYFRDEVKALLNQKFDLILTQPTFNECALGLVYKLKAPFILFSPMQAPNFMVEKLGGYYPSSFVSNIFLGYNQDMTFLQRFHNFGFNFFMSNLLRFYYEPIMEATYRDGLGDQSIPPAREILANASLMLSNGHFSLNQPKPNLPNVIDVGGIHSRPAKPLPKDLEDFVSKSGKDGFILFSMGSALKGTSMSEAKRKLFLNVFSKLKQQVIWKWESETMENLPKNVKLSKWVPQQDLLGHKGIKMFITHCGGGSSEEAIYHAVPLLGLPMFGDQYVNAKQAIGKGYLVQLEWNDLTEENLSDSINEILNNPKYHDNVKRLSTVFRDQPNDPLQRGVYWMEYVIRHKGAHHMQSASRKLNTIQYHSLDVIASYLAIIFGIIYVIFAVLRFIVRKVFRIGNKTNSKVANGTKSNGSKKRN